MAEQALLSKGFKAGHPLMIECSIPGSYTTQDTERTNGSVRENVAMIGLD